MLHGLLPLDWHVNESPFRLLDHFRHPSSPGEAVFNQPHAVLFFLTHGQLTSDTAEARSIRASFRMFQEAGVRYF